jgi:hypothetical protein
MSTYDDASLVLVPSGYKNGVVFSQKPMDANGQLTFTRASSATRVGPNGYIEKVRENLFRQSQALATTWAPFQPSGGGTIVRTNNYAEAPDGTMTATRIQNTGTSPFQWVYQNFTHVNNTISVYAKSTSGTNQTFRLFGGNGALNSANFTATNTWQRFTFRVSGITAVEPIGIAADNSGNAYDILFWGAQLETGDVATDYIPTTTAAVSVGPVSGTPRLDYLNGECPSLLLEPQRSNLAIQSEQLNLWNGADASVTANASVSPDGYQNADNVNITGTNGYWRRNPLTFANSTSYTASIFVKKSATTGTKTFKFYYNNNAGSPNNGEWTCIINLTNITATTTTVGTAGTGAPTILSTKIVDYGSGWYRVEVAFTTGSGAGNSSSEIGFSADGVVVDFEAWGAQVELGAYATSYIPTLGTSVTRVADAASKTGISSLIGQTEGVIFIDFVASAQNQDGVTYSVITYFGDGSGNLQLYTIGGATLRWYAFVTGGAIFDQLASQTLVAGQRYKIAYAYKSGDWALYINGVQKSTRTDAIIPAVSQFNFNSDSPGASVAKVENKFNQVLLFKTRLTNAQLAELTTL